MHSPTSGSPLLTMARLLWTVALLGALHSTVSKPLNLDKRWEDLEVKHEWTHVPRGWVEVGRPPADYPLKINIGLKQGRFDELLEHLYEVSDPEHYRYAPIHVCYAQYSLTRPECPDMETTSRRRRSAN